MKNLTIALSESLLREARKVAVERSMSLNSMIRNFLEEETARASEVARARKRIAEMCRATRAEIGQRTWSREDLHER